MRIGGKGGRWRWALAALGVALLAAGLGLLAASEMTPAYKDAEGYRVAVQAVYSDYYHGVLGHEAGIDAFYDALDRFETRHWLYADLAWVGLSWGALALAVSVGLASGVRLTTRRGAIVAPMAALAIGLFFFGLAASPVLLFQREHLPPWSDTIGIPIIGAMVVTAFVAVLLALFVVPPLFLRREARGLFRSARAWPATVIATVIYLPLLAGAVFMLEIAVEPGGWIASLGLWLMIWLLLNARATWLGDKVSSTLP